MERLRFIVQPVPKEPASFRDPKKEKDLRHNSNLHGGERFDGLTGFYHRRYYRNGRYEPNKKK